MDNATTRETLSSTITAQIESAVSALSKAHGRLAEQTQALIQGDRDTLTDAIRAFQEAEAALAVWREAGSDLLRAERRASEGGDLGEVFVSLVRRRQVAAWREGSRAGDRAGAALLLSKAAAWDRMLSFGLDL